MIPLFQSNWYHSFSHKVQLTIPNILNHIYSKGKVNINLSYTVSYDILYLMKFKYKWQYTLLIKLKKIWKFAHHSNRQSFISWHSYVFVCSNALCVINRSNDLNIIIIPQIMDLNSTTVFKTRDVKWNNPVK